MQWYALIGIEPEIIKKILHFFLILYIYIYKNSIGGQPPPPTVEPGVVRATTPTTLGGGLAHP